ncbi:MAG: iron-containing alcohol dehydrogenase [Treponema sp.]|nr:iron-containing alcohol dehydrogenase [Treponema sp.]
MNDLFEKAKGLISAWKGNDYIFGRGVLPQIGRLVSRYGKNAMLVCSSSHIETVAGPISDSLKKAGVSLAGGGIVPGAAPNTPRSDVYRIETWFLHHEPDVIVAAGGGSTIDACKASNFLACLGKTASPEIDHWFGTGVISAALAASGKKLTPVVAVQTSASSGAHLTKYSNITDLSAGQKKLIVDDAIVPRASLFDYDTTASVPIKVTMDGILDSFSHCFEVFTGLPADTPREKYDLAASIAGTVMELVLKYAMAVIKNPSDMEARQAIGLASDLGAYAIMIGGTHGPHMTSFSLIGLAGHGTACGIMNPYYAVLFAPAIENQLRLVCGLLARYGFIKDDPQKLSGRELGLAFAGGMTVFGKSINAPVTLGELFKWDQTYIAKILDAAKDPQLEMKLRNMPVPISASEVDEYIGSVIKAAVSGDFSLIKTISVG